VERRKKQGGMSGNASPNRKKRSTQNETLRSGGEGKGWAGEAEKVGIFIMEKKRPPPKLKKKKGKKGNGWDRFKDGRAGKEKPILNERKKKKKLVGKEKKKSWIRLKKEGQASLKGGKKGTRILIMKKDKGGGKRERKTGEARKGE